MLIKQMELFKENDSLTNLKQRSFGVFSRLDSTQQYRLAFSGGKDSHVLLGIYLEWVEVSSKSLDIKVVFSDTQLESAQLYHLIDRAREVCTLHHIPFQVVQPLLKDNFWVKLIGYGYPVPNWRNRWCTGRLKVIPMSKIPGIVIAGSHVGESSKRDRRLKTCGSTECGVDLIENKIEPLTWWRNCDIWDWIILESDKALYQGASDNLLSLYDISSSDSSLRMGCFMCPVITQSKIVSQVQKGITPPVAIQVRNFIEELRKAPRILSPRTKKSGAMLVDARIEFWEKMQPLIPVLKEQGWLTQEVQAMVETLLEVRAYPPTYPKAWIAQQEPLAQPWR